MHQVVSRDPAEAPIPTTDDIAALKRIAEELQDSQRDLEDFFENAAVALHLVAANGTILRANRAELDLLGYTADEYIGHHIGEFHADRPASDEILNRLCRGEKLDKHPAQLRAKDGAIKHVLITSNGKFRNGKLVNTRCFTLDVTDQKLATDALAERERRFHEILEALPAAIYTTDAEGRITYFNQAAAEFSGLKPAIGLGAWCVTWRLYYPDGRPMPHADCPMAVALKEGRPIRGAEAVAERPDGTRVPFLPFPTPLYDMAGNLIGAVNMLVDISERKEAEARQKRLIDELNHRVKNTLATVQSLAGQTFRRAGVPPEARDVFEARLFALSRAHDQLTNAHWASAEFRALAHDICAPYRGEADRIRLEGPPVKLSPRAALTLAMVLHELATNAAKYGALSAPGGTVSVSWNVANGTTTPAMHIAWRETGGPQVKPPKRRGFGSRLVEQGVHQELDGAAAIAFERDGLTCNIDFPLTAGEV